MLAAGDIMRLCAPGPSDSEETEDCLRLEDTPSSDCASRLKRQRLLEASSDESIQGCSGQSSQHTWAQPAEGCGTPAQAPPPPAPAAPPPLAPTSADIPWQASYLLDYLHRCLEALTALHPVCSFIQTDTKAAHMALAIFRRAYLQRSGPERAMLLRERLLVQALLAASLWVAIKWEATRTTTPDSNLMYRITGIPAAFLQQQEREILAALQWDLMTPAREVGAAGAVELSDAPARDQQAQLAALVASSPPQPRPAPAAQPATAAWCGVWPATAAAAAAQPAALAAGQGPVRGPRFAAALFVQGGARGPAPPPANLLPPPPAGAQRQPAEAAVLCV